MACYGKKNVYCQQTWITYVFGLSGLPGHSVQSSLLSDSVVMRSISALCTYNIINVSSPEKPVMLFKVMLRLVWSPVAKNVASE